MRVRARHYQTADLLDVECAEGRIASIGPPTGGPVDVEAGWIAPGLFDLQVNGCDGKSFNSPELTVEDVAHVVATCRRHGVVGLCPTLVTNSREALLHGFATLRRACELSPDLDRAIPA